MWYCCCSGTSHNIRGPETRRMGRNRSGDFRRDPWCFNKDLMLHFLQLEKDWRPFFHWHSPSDCSYIMKSQVRIKVAECIIRVFVMF